MDFNEYEGGEVVCQAAETFLGEIGCRKAFLETTVIRYPAHKIYESYSSVQCVLTLKPRVWDIGIVPELKIGFTVDSDAEDWYTPLDVFRRLIDEVEHKLSLGASECE